MNEFEYLILKEKAEFKILVFASFIFFTFLSILNIVKNNYLGSLLFIPFIILSIYETTFFGTTYINSKEIIHKNIFGTHMIHWIDVNKIIFSYNNETIVFKGYKKCLVIPGFKYVTSKDINELFNLFEFKKEYNTIEMINKNMLMFKLSKGCKVDKDILNI